MPDILHRIGATDASPDQVYQAITTCDGVSAWMTPTTGEEDLSGVLRHSFGEGKGSVDVEVVELRPAERVRWSVVDGPPQWLGTNITFDIKQDGDTTVVLFRHDGWAEPDEFMHHCSTKWGMFMLSLKMLVETGTGRPVPDDVPIGNW